jgi:hypothetical protein
MSSWSLIAGLQVSSDAGGTDRLCNSFGMCESNPIDSPAVVNYVGNARHRIGYRG